MNKIFKFDEIAENGAVNIYDKKTKYYTNIVAAYSKAYYAWKKLKADIEAGRVERYTVYASGSSIVMISPTTDHLADAETTVKNAYVDVFDAELAAHSGPVAWGLDKRLLEWAPGKSVFDVVKEKGASIFYRKVNKKADLLINPMETA